MKILIAIASAAGLALVAFRQQIRSLFARAAEAAPASSPPPALDDVVGCAYPYLSKWTDDERAALGRANKSLGLDAQNGAISTVIEHESGGDPTAPHEAKGTPRGGLIQLTQGARLPGFDSADKVWAIRSMSIVDQLDKVVVPYFARKHLPPDVSGRMLLRQNFLPGVAHEADAFVLGVKEGATGPNGETSDTRLMEGSSLTLGQIFRDNPYFSRGKDFFTWGDVDADTARIEARAKGRLITRSGKIVEALS